MYYRFLPRINRKNSKKCIQTKKDVVLRIIDRDYILVIHSSYK